MSNIFHKVHMYVDSLPPGMRDLAGAVVGKAEAAAEKYPDWPLLALPGGLCAAFGVPAERAEALLAGAVLFYGAADVTDDAQDGDLQADPWGEPPWHKGVNLGNALAFAALAGFLDAVGPEGAWAMAHAFSDAGVRMASGQHLDFELGPGGSAHGEDEYLQCIEGKSGGSLGLFCAAAGLAGERPEAEIEQLDDLGRCVGAAIQIRSDVQEIWSDVPSRDMANGKRTLPVIYALTTLDEPGKARLRELMGDPARKPELVALLGTIGAASYCDLRIQMYGAQALMALSRLDIDEQAHAELRELVAGLSEPASRVPI